MKRTVPRPRAPLQPNQRPMSAVKPPPRHVRPPPRPRHNKTNTEHACACCDHNHHHHHAHTSSVRPPPRRVVRPRPRRVVKPPPRPNPNQTQRRNAWHSHSQDIHNRRNNHPARALAPTTTPHEGHPTPPRGKPPRARHRPMSAASYFSSRKTPQEPPRGPPRRAPSLGSKSAALNELIRAQDVTVGTR